MRVIINLASTILIAAMFISCGQHEEHDNDHDHEHEHQGDVGESDGKIWKANEETTIGISNMADLMDAMPEKEREDVSSYNALSEDLLEQFNMIFEKCTMTGEAHEQLHTYLLPMKGSFQELSSNDLDLCKQGFEHLRMHLDEYTNHFN